MALPMLFDIDSYGQSFNIPVRSVVDCEYRQVITGEAQKRRLYTLPDTCDNACRNAEAAIQAGHRVNIWYIQGTNHLGDTMAHCSFSLVSE